MKMDDVRFDSEAERKNRIYIDFKMNNEFSYYLVLDKTFEEIWEPAAVFHREPKSDKICLYCGDTDTGYKMCRVLTRLSERTKIYDMLINHPNIRIKSILKGIVKK